MIIINNDSYRACNNNTIRLEDQYYRKYTGVCNLASLTITLK